jgi:hypothetical protein
MALHRWPEWPMREKMLINQIGAALHGREQKAT